MPGNNIEEPDFTAWLISDIASMKALGYVPTRFLQMVREHGGLQACKMLLRPEVPASYGFCRLRQLNRLDLSVEHIALSDEWGRLFSEQERAAARFRIANADALCADSTLIGE